MKLKWDFFQDYIIPHPKVNYDINALSSLSSSHCVGLLCVKCIGDRVLGHSKFTAPWMYSVSHKTATVQGLYI